MDTTIPTPTERALFQAREAVPGEWTVYNEEPVELHLQLSVPYWGERLNIRLKYNIGEGWFCFSNPGTVNAKGITVEACLTAFVQRLRSWMTTVDMAFPPITSEGDATPLPLPATPEERAAALLNGQKLPEGLRERITEALAQAMRDGAAAQLARDTEIANDYALMGLDHTWTHRLGKELRDRLRDPQARPLAYLREPVPPERQAWFNALAARLKEMYPEA